MNSSRFWRQQIGVTIIRHFDHRLIINSWKHYVMVLRAYLDILVKESARLFHVSCKNDCEFILIVFVRITEQ